MILQDNKEATTAESYDIMPSLREEWPPSFVLFLDGNVNIIRTHLIYLNYNIIGTFKSPITFLIHNKALKNNLVWERRWPFWILSEEVYLNRGVIFIFGLFTVKVIFVALWSIWRTFMRHLCHLFRDLVHF